MKGGEIMTYILIALLGVCLIGSLLGLPITIALIVFKLTIIPNISWLEAFLPMIFMAIASLFSYLIIKSSNKW